MKVSILTLIVILSLILATQVAALFVQYRVNRSYKGIAYWLLGSVLMVLGFILMPMVASNDFKKIAIIANPLMILGHIFLYIGVKRFLDKKLNIWIPILSFVVFNLFYYYYMFINNSIPARTVVISATLAFVSFLTAYELFFKKGSLLSNTTNFTGTVFSVYGCVYVIRVIFTVILNPGNSYLDQGYSIIYAVTFDIIMSNLWTFGLIIMVNQRLNKENELEKEKLQLIFDTNIDAQLITRLKDGLIVNVNDEFSILSGYPKDEVIGSPTKEFYFWHNSKERQAFITELNDKGICQDVEFVFRRKDKSQFAGVISARVVTINSITHIISVISDITERKKFEKALIESEEKYRSILNASPDDITITDLDGRIEMISPAAKEIFGYDSEFDNYIGMQLLDFIVPEDVERAKANIQQMYQGIKRSTNEYHGVHQDQSIFDIEVNSGFIYNANGLPDKMVFIIRDITKRKLIETQMGKLVQQLEIEKNTAQLNAITDSLTGLFNRGYFDNMLRSEFFRLMRSGSILSLIMLDIDHFKKFNDSYGHLAGDKCIQMISTMLKTTVERASDIAARYGGEEFIVILPETDETGAKILGDRIRKGVEDFAIPHVTSETAKYVTVSVGVVTVYPSELVSPDQVLKLVDEALYSAKEKGRNCCVYSANSKYDTLNVLK